MAVLVIADNDNAHLRDATHKTVTAALKISGDVDVLVEFTPATLPGFGFFRLERDLAALFGRPVDLVTPDALHDLIQERVLDEAVFA